MFNRSYHFIPANKPKLFDRVATLGADAYIFDLEDAVPGSEKNDALRHLAAWLDQPEPSCPMYLRVNGCGHALAPLEKTLLKNCPWLGLVLPKIQYASDIERSVDEYALEAHRKVVGLIESPLGLRNVESIATIHPLQALGLGLEDFLCQSIFPVSQLESLVDHIRVTLALAAMSAGIESIDTISLDFSGGPELQADLSRARSAGFSGKFSIHPSQIAAINQCFYPDPALLKQARTLGDSLNTFDDESGYLRLDNELLSPPKLKKLKHALAHAKHHHN